ncbi:EF-hand domain-containing protein [Fulvimonas soli]|jgi:hypothetical protein|uniref:EF-hand domain-containing protein n=1 Tax=Fulvimonas soli TaxID=155197 RepID=A0A316I3Q2_9GAMM|nr:EF-hand domain-containing protein [Fulvimonas soli]PWK87616.1 hypothetical protein C7456_106109 [Fulvimonas soli]TNY25801.1 hypothetical protein BV497_11975 [Fulvimonas soli]
MRNAPLRHSIVLAGLLLAGTASARQTTPPPTNPPSLPPPAPEQQPMPQQAPAGVPSFDSLDTAHRGYLKRSDIPRDVESLQQLRAHFPEADRDGNGRLTPDEYAAYTQQAPNGSQP